jgi:hypothetical protein
MHKTFFSCDEVDQVPIVGGLGQASTISDVSWTLFQKSSFELHLRLA